MARTQVEFVELEPAPFIERRQKSRQSTSVDPDETSWNAPRNAPRQDRTETAFLKSVKIRDIRPVLAAPAVEQPRDSVRGAITEVLPASVTCILDVAGRRVEVALLPDIFPEPPRFGMTFEMSMHDVGGVQQPRIVLLPAEEANDELAREVDEILREL